MRIGILVIGSELLDGKVLNTNCRDIATLLYPLGHEVLFSFTVGDDEGRILQALESATKTFPVDAVVMTGGLGPTHDDRTRQALARYLDVTLEASAEARQWMAAYLKRPEEQLGESQERQSLIPLGSRALRNEAGTACGILAHAGDLKIFAFPGVPSELRYMVANHLLPALASNGQLLEKKIWTFGLPESEQRRRLEGLTLDPGFDFSSLPSERGVEISLKMRCPASQATEVQTKLESNWARVLGALPAETLVHPDGLDLCGTLHNLILEKKFTIAVAESCTTGALAFLLTGRPGSSGFFKGGFLTYSNQTKTRFLGVPEDMLSRYGAVSRQVVEAMVAGCLERSGADYACATSGLAGPAGGTEDKPVGTVWMAIGNNLSINSSLWHFRGDRTTIRWAAAYAMLNFLRLTLLEGDHPSPEKSVSA